jgi:hypothetical protein
VTEHPFIDVLTKLQYDLTSIQARVTDLKRNLALELPDERPAHRCDECGLPLLGALKLAEHRYLSHDGPEPEHWIAAEAQSA